MENQLFHLPTLLTFALPFRLSLHSMDMDMDTSTQIHRVGIAIVVLHLLVSAAHGAAHTAMQIGLSSWQNAYVLIVITVLPLVSGVLIWRYRGSGFFLLFASMLGSLIFGVYYHFILSGPDNVAHLGQHSWALPFQVSAAILALTEIAGAAIGLAGLVTKSSTR